ncbi:MAG: M14 family metallopeptidase [Planctomycetota bacterium]
MLPTALAPILLSLLALPQDSPPAELRTVAEASEWTATATSAEVDALLARIAARSGVMHLGAMGASAGGKSLPFAVLGDPLVTTPNAIRAAGKPVVFAFGNIHAGEVDGKEALLMLVRELATTPDHPLLDELIVLVAPNYNPDGNDEMDPGNRPGQEGPVAGMGERENGMGLDLNRDWMKAEAPETQAFLRVLNEYDPHLVIDTHTTNGSAHRYALTFSAPLNPAGHGPSIALVRDELLPAVSERMRERTGYDSFFYGDFDRDHTTWTTYSADPRFGGAYHGLRGQLSILSEAYAYASYRDRVLATREFVREILRYVAERKEEVLAIHERAKADTIRAGANPQPDDVVGLRFRPAAFPRPAVVRGWAWETDAGGRRRRTEESRDYTVVHVGCFEPAVSVRRPYAYLLEPDLDAVVEKLREHGIAVEPFAGGASVESYRVLSIEAGRREFQGHRMLSLEVEASDARIELGPGAAIVRTAQPLGNLAVSLLEPQAVDGLAAWNFLDGRIAAGEPFPIHRVRSARDLD